jgi:hypothetical protein
MRPRSTIMRLAIIVLLGLSLMCTGCILIPAAYGGFGVYSSTSAAAKDKAKAGEVQPPAGKPEATPPKP